jgi:iron complex transport system substrate-binding protein
MRASLRAITLLAALLCACTEPAGERTEHEDILPVQRIVALSPHLAELVFAAGAGDRLVGVSAYSDYPPAVLGLPVVGDAFLVDQEQLALLKPQLLLAWQSGTPAHVVDELRGQGYRVEVIPSRGIADVGRALMRIGVLAGTSDIARHAAQQFNESMGALAAKWSNTESVRVFYQISPRPLYTVTGDHYVSELISMCGGKNVFAELRELAPLVSEEAVLQRDPEVLLAAAVAGENAFADWSRWPAMAANRYGNHFTLPASEIGRATPRLLVAGVALCNAIQSARDNRNRYSDAG